MYICIEKAQNINGAEALSSWKQGSTLEGLLTKNAFHDLVPRDIPVS